MLNEFEFVIDRFNPENGKRKKMDIAYRVLPFLLQLRISSHTVFHYFVYYDTKISKNLFANYFLIALLIRLPGGEE